MPQKAIHVRCTCRDSLGAVATTGVPHRLLGATRRTAPDPAEFDEAWRRLHELRQHGVRCPVCHQPITIHLTSTGFASGLHRNQRAAALATEHLRRTRASTDPPTTVVHAWALLRAHFDPCPTCSTEGLVATPSSADVVEYPDCQGIGFLDPHRHGNEAERDPAP